MKLQAGYICQKCGMDVTDVQVRERAPDEDVVNYVHHVGNVCGQNHRIRSPMCGARNLDIKIPMTQAGIGFDGPELTEEQKADLRKQAE
jgi:C4-type Zn-finger protein